MATWVDKRPSNQISRKTRDCLTIAGFFFGKITARLAGQTERQTMNRNYLKVPTRFGPETRFEVEPAAPATFRATEETRLERLKDRLLRRVLYEEAEARAHGYVRRAANEAAALAWVTPYPLLVFPALFEEKAEAARLQARRQERVRQRSLELLPA